MEERNWTPNMKTDINAMINLRIDFLPSSFPFLFLY